MTSLKKALAMNRARRLLEYSPGVDYGTPIYTLSTIKLDFPEDVGVWRTAEKAFREGKPYPPEVVARLTAMLMTGE